MAEEPKSGKRKSNDVRNKIHASHEIQADAILNQGENKRKACSGGSGGGGEKVRRARGLQGASSRAGLAAAAL